MDAFLALVFLESGPAAPRENLLREAEKAIRRVSPEGAPFRSCAGLQVVFACSAPPGAPDTSVAVSDDGRISYLCGRTMLLSSQDRERVAGRDADGLPAESALRAFRACALAAPGGRPALEGLSGSYCGLVHDPGTGQTVVATDRLGSRPVFVQQSPGLLCLSSDIRCLLSLPGADQVLDMEGLVQFVRLQAILAERTLYRAIRVLGPATRLSIDARSGAVTRHQYWRLTRLEPFATEPQAIEGTAAVFGTATRRVLEDSRRAAILLSGGLDSRMLAACAPASEGRVHQACTFQAAPNDESPIARQVAECAGLPWMLVEQDVAAYWRAMPRALVAANGLYSLGHMHTYLAAEALAGAGFDTILDGWGLDLPFSGSYLPKASLEVAGRPLYGHWLRRVTGKGEVAGYLWQVLDLGGGSGRSLLGPALQDLWERVPAQAVAGLVEEASLLSDDPYDWIDAVLFGFGVAKFRSYLMVTGIRAHLRERNPLFESDVIEVYQRLPHAWRFMGRVFRRALQALNPGLTRLPYANTGTSPLASPARQMLSLQGGGVLRANRARVAGMLRAVGVPIARGRAHGCYPTPGELAGHLVGHGPGPSRARDLLEKGCLAECGVVDAGAVREALREEGAGAEVRAEALLPLVTLAMWCGAHPPRVP